MPRYSENRTFSLYVTGFSEATRPILLTKLFERYGPVADDWLTHQHRGFAYVVFENDEDAKSAVESTESFVLDGRVLSVQFARGSKRGGPWVKGSRLEHPMEIPNQLPEHTRRPGNAPLANHRKHSRNASQSPIQRTRRHTTLPPCRRHDRHCCLHNKRGPTPSSSSYSSSYSCSRSPSPVRKAPVPETLPPESRHHRRHHRSEKTSVSPEPDAPMPMPKREDAKRSGSVRNGSVHKDEISLSVDDCDW
ncbi:Arginine/serine-rich splicing factor scl25a transcript I [Podila minutissima]|uniref:Arginine/serine-rich splicing factor scl25a transcript I n=1 Tax=Podila minutissima TaxID=64525 RepID=A0A9P5SBS9_9FUNG|nr:Arginine/serine-rich splicing factor scl25a transcript I [Podila minutissima]